MMLLAAVLMRLLTSSSKFTDPINLKAALAMQNCTPASKSTSKILIPISEKVVNKSGTFVIYFNVRLELATCSQQIGARVPHKYDISNPLSPGSTAGIQVRLKLNLRLLMKPVISKTDA